MNISDLLKYPELADIVKVKDKIKEVDESWSKDDEIFEIDVYKPTIDIDNETIEKIGEKKLERFFERWDIEIMPDYWDKVDKLIRKNFEIVKSDDFIDYTKFELKFDLSNEEVVNDLINLNEYWDKLLEEKVPIEKKINELRSILEDLKYALKMFNKNEVKQKIMKKELESDLDSLYNEYVDMLKENLKKLI